LTSRRAASGKRCAGQGQREFARNAKIPVKHLK
jgi:hypothetical protein